MLRNVTHKKHFIFYKLKRYILKKKAFFTLFYEKKTKDRYEKTHIIHLKI